jgi:prolyl oligopeptidase
VNIALFSTIVLFLTTGCATPTLQPPQTPTNPITDTYHGVEVIDNYRWLEDGSDPAVQAWAQAQNDYARSYLDAIPARAAIVERLNELYREGSEEYWYFTYRPGMLFALKSLPEDDQPRLVVMNSAHKRDSERIILDLNAYDTTGLTSVDWYRPSFDGKLIAVSLSVGGTEWGTVHVFNAADGTETGEMIPRVNGPTAGGGMAWTADGSGFYYTRYPYEGERAPEDMSFYQQVYYHKLGTPIAEDTYVVGREFPRIAEVELEASEDGRYYLATVADGDGGEFTHHLRGPDEKWVQITHNEDLISTCHFGPDNSVFMYSVMNAPKGKIIRLAAGETDVSRATTIVKQSDVVIKSFTVARSRIYVRDLVGGPSQIRIVDFDGEEKGTIPILPVSSVWGLTALDGDRILYSNSSYTRPTAWYTYNPDADDPAGQPQQTEFAVTTPADFSEIEVVREFATSKDGTQIPLNILRRKGTRLDGSNPTILYGYGGYGISQTPYFDRKLSIWLAHGGVYATANTRGGSEFGEEWHKAGYLTNKQNVFDDFIACAEYLIEAKYTNPDKLAILGGSNGGLLVGATLVQRPELFKAVVGLKGVYDMLRVELDPNGAFNVTEYGTVKDPEQFKALYAYSPYNNVKNGVRYPDCLFTADENDGRVNPSNSRKMTAAVQAATTNPGPVLLRMSASIGHGIGGSLDDKIALDADWYAFLFDRLRVQHQAR